MNKVYIFGAHSRARTTAGYLRESDKDLSLLAYLIDNDEDNVDELDGIPVIDIRKSSAYDTDAAVYIGTRGIFFSHATDVLSSLGFSDIRPVDIKLDTKLRSEYFKKRFAAEGRALIKIDDLMPGSLKSETDVCVYEVRSVFDKPLVKDSYVSALYERSIQVGTDLTDIRLKECTYYDNKGDNISKMNRQLCEITAMYWMWKHSDFDIIGLVHYRRHFLMPDRWIERMLANGVDIILPLPLYTAPSVEGNYRFRHISSDWDHMLEFMEMKHNDKKEDIKKCFSDTYYYPCNMFVMKKNVFEEYCSWLFPILFYVMDKVGSREDTYQNRYPAFMAERLLTLFCYINRDRFRIVSADKNFLQ